MRPPEFTGGNVNSVVSSLMVIAASMRPPEFTGGNLIRGTASSG